MVKKAKSPKPAKLKSSPTAKSSAGSSAIGMGISAGKKLLGIGGGKTKGGRRSRKKSALWYAKEIQRLKLKKRYEKVKLGVMR